MRTMRRIYVLSNTTQRLRHLNEQSHPQNHCGVTRTLFQVPKVSLLREVQTSMSPNGNSTVDRFLDLYGSNRVLDQ